MKLYCRGGRVIATHGDGQDVDPAEYGSDVYVVIVRGDGPGRVQPLDPVPPLDEESFRATVKAECSRRIKGVLRDLPTQINMTAAAVSLGRKEAAGQIGDGDAQTLATLEAGLTWVREMQAVARAMTAGDDADWAKDTAWPPPPDGLADLARQF